MTKSISLLLTCALVLGLSSCSFSKQGRQQRAYEKYVRKSSVARAKQRSVLKSTKSELPPSSTIPSEPVESTESGPQSLPPEGSGE